MSPGARKREGKRARGECYDCPRAAVKGKRRCLGHLRKSNNDRTDAWRGRLERGQCPECGGPPESSSTRCRICRLSRQANEQALSTERKAQGLCRCGRKPLKDSAECRKCRLRRTKAG